jgi:hypothetical protein
MDGSEEMKWKRWRLEGSSSSSRWWYSLEKELAHLRAGSLFWLRGGKKSRSLSTCLSFSCSKLCAVNVILYPPNPTKLQTPVPWSLSFHQSYLQLTPKHVYHVGHQTFAPSYIGPSDPKNWYWRLFPAACCQLSAHEVMM